MFIFFTYDKVLLLYRRMASFFFLRRVSFGNLKKDSLILATWEDESRRVMVQASRAKNLDIVVCACCPASERSLKVRARLARAKTRPHPKITRRKGPDGWLKW